MIYIDSHPLVKRYTWRKRNPLKQARLDFLLVSNHMSDIVKSCDIKAGYRSDHSIIELELLMNKFIKGKGIWKFNNSLLKHQDYLTLINNTIEAEVERYALPVYHYTFLKSPDNYKDIIFRIDRDTLLEVLMMRIQGETIKFSSNLKKKKTALKRSS